MKIEIRDMIESDIAAFPEAFARQGWHKPVSQYERYYREHREGRRRVIVATADGVPAGYLTLFREAWEGPFKGKGVPIVIDFNVLVPYQRHGIGSALMDAVEAAARAMADRICIGVGLHAGYGAAQRMYVKRGYIPDGSGVWYENKQLAAQAPCKNDDELVLYLSKNLA